MAAQDVARIRAAPTTPTTTAAAASANLKSKRARTKHACDECRRSQKKCDGDKPLCRRCYLNGTQCTYTPHKSRSQCACTGQPDDTRRAAPIPDVFIFSDASVGSFHAWSTASSPNQSPTTSGSGLDELSPTYHTHDDSPRSAVLEMSDGCSKSSSTFSCAAPASQMQVKQSPSPFQRNIQLYPKRSQSVPSFFPDASPSPSASCRTSSYTAAYPSSSPRDHYTFEEAPMILESEVSPSHSNQLFDTNTDQHHRFDGSAQSELSHYVQIETGSTSIYGFTPHFNQHHVELSPQSSFFSDAATSISATQQQQLAYDVQQQYHFQQNVSVPDSIAGSYEIQMSTGRDASSIELGFQSGNTSPNAFNGLPAQSQPQVPLLPRDTPSHPLPSPQYGHFAQQQQQHLHTTLAHRGEHVEYARAQLHAAHIGIGSVDAAAGSRNSHTNSMRLNLPASQFSPQHWCNGPAGGVLVSATSSPPASLSPGSSYSSPAAFGNGHIDYYDWSQ